MLQFTVQTEPLSARCLRGHVGVATEVSMLTASRDAAVRSGEHLTWSHRSESVIQLWSFDHHVSLRLYQQTLESFTD